LVVLDIEFRISDFEFRISDIESRISNLESRMILLGFRTYDKAERLLIQHYFNFNYMNVLHTL